MQHSCGYAHEMYALKVNEAPVCVNCRGYVKGAFFVKVRVCVGISLPIVKVVSSGEFVEPAIVGQTHSCECHALRRGEPLGEKRLFVV